jgi:environmental stress-induced protein Ves
MVLKLSLPIHALNIQQFLPLLPMTSNTKPFVITIHSAADRKPIAWASGTSTEVFVYPADGDFKTRNFSFRISTATVEADETTFSDFSGLTRILMPLKGDLTLIHEGRYTKELKPFDQDVFDGSWNTRSKGKVQDFNVMFKSPFSAAVLHHHLTTTKEFNSPENKSHHFIYAVDGEYMINEFKISPGDLVEIHTNETVSLQPITNGNVIEIAILDS